MTSKTVGKKVAVFPVETLRKTFVKPNKPLGIKYCQLTSFDLQYLFISHIQRLLIFKSIEKFDEIEKILKEGLSVVLEDFYPVAGKIRKDEEGILQVLYDDDMDGVEMAVAAAEDIEVAEMINGDKITHFKEFLPCSGVLNWEGIHRSLFTVKLTKLKDGFALGCAFNHAIMDGSSVWQFMKSWSETCNNGSTTISLKPFHDRTKARNTQIKLDLPQKSQDQDLNSTTATTPIINHTLFKFSESAINKIKSNLISQINPTKPKPKPFSTFECLSAHVWMAITRARRLKPEDRTVFTTFADIRKRIEPPMPENYFGNLIQQIITSTTASILLNDPPEASTSLIQEAIENLDSNAINKVLKTGKRTRNWEFSRVLDPILYLLQARRSLRYMILISDGENQKGYGSDPIKYMMVWCICIKVKMEAILLMWIYV